MYFKWINVPRQSKFWHVFIWQHYQQYGCNEPSEFHIQSEKGQGQMWGIEITSMRCEILIKCEASTSFRNELDQTMWSDCLVSLALVEDARCCSAITLISYVFDTVESNREWIHFHSYTILPPAFNLVYYRLLFSRSNMRGWITSIVELLRVSVSVHASGRCFYPKRLPLISQVGRVA